jgi:predicted sugar kinase
VARAKELPQQVGEFVELAKEYTRQRTVEPAKALGRAAGLGFAAALLLALAAIFLAVAGLRLIVDALPDTLIWSGFGYVIAAVGLLIIAGIVGWRAAK